MFFWFSIPNSLFNKPMSCVIFDSNNNFLGAHIATDGQWRFKKVNKVPYKFKTCLIAFEDKRFYSHSGVDYLAIMRSTWLNVKNFRKLSGASTITMQVIRLYRNKERTILQKIIEIFLAHRLELTNNKANILKLYCSFAPFGGNVVGLDAASWRYFGIQAEELTWAQSACLAVLPNAPSLIHINKNRRQLLQKRNKLLKKIYKNGNIKKEDYILALQEKLPNKLHKFPQHAAHLLNQSIKDFPNEAVIKTTLKLDYQNKLNFILDIHHKKLQQQEIHNAAAIIIDVKTGEILAYIGNVGKFSNGKNSSQVDNIIAPRSSGSILKPFLYASMLSDGEILPNTLVPDIPIHIRGYAPKNYKRDFDGAVPASKALARSLNIPAVKMLQDYGIEKFHFQLQKLGLRHVNKAPSHYGLSLILGGAEVSLWDLCSAYTFLARKLNNYSEYNSKYDANDKNEIYYKKKQKKNKNIKLTDNSILDASAIYYTFQAMLDVDRPSDDYFWQYFNSSQNIAWKTGTSFGFRDAWAIGITPRFVVGVWVGNSDGEGRPGIVGIKAAAPILFDIFDFLPKATHWFDNPYDDMIELEVCKKSGYLASNICEGTEKKLLPKKAEYFKKCPYHKIVHLDETEQYRVNADCHRQQSIVNKSWFILPPTMEWYYKQKNADYRVLPMIREDCQSQEDNSAMEIIYPKNVEKIFIPREIDGSKGEVVFEAKHRRTNAKIFWHINNKFIEETTNFHQIAVSPKAGKYLLSIVDDKGETIAVWFEIVRIF